jgi:hypothetical protein
MMAIWAATVLHVVLHRHIPAVQEVPGFVEFLARSIGLAERVGFEPTIRKAGF